MPPSAMPEPHEDRIRVDLGCGAMRRDGFIGLDHVAGPGVDIVLDLTTDRYPFDDDSVDEVYSAHFLEHIREPNHVFEEIGRICRDGAHLEFWTPYAFTNEAFLYGHVQGFTEELWNHFGVAHRDTYVGMLKGRWQIDRFVYIVGQGTIDELAAHQVDLDFAIRYFKGVVNELGVEVTFRRDLDVPVQIPERVYALNRFGERHRIGFPQTPTEPEPAARSLRDFVARARDRAARVVGRSS
jgi:predicted SAM-dependent methyltransferase